MAPKKKVVCGFRRLRRNFRHSYHLLRSELMALAHQHSLKAGWLLWGTVQL